MSSQAQPTPEITATAPVIAPAPKVKISRKERRRLKEQRQLQERTTTILPSTTFKRLVGEIASQYKTDFRFQGDATRALQVAAEEHLTNVFHGAAVVAQTADRDTVYVKDIRTYQYLNGL